MYICGFVQQRTVWLFSMWNCCALQHVTFVWLICGRHFDSCNCTFDVFEKQLLCNKLFLFLSVCIDWSVKMLRSIKTRFNEAVFGFVFVFIQTTIDII